MTSSPRVLLFDIETRYIVFRGWATGKQYVSHNQIIDGQTPDIICLSYKWLGDPKVYSLDWGLKAQNSSKLISEFTKVVETADIVIGHNSNSFDIKHVNTQRMLNGQPPIAWPTADDTYRQIKKHFALPSYSLDYLSKITGGKGKDRMGFADWVDVVEKKDPKALKKMIDYNRNDVLELERVYKKLSAFFSPKINASLITNGDKSGCPRCGSMRTKSKGIKTLIAGRYRVRRCLVCLHSFRTSERA